MGTINDNEMQAFFSEWYANSSKLQDNEKLNNIGHINRDIFLPRNMELNYETMQKNLHMIFGENANVEKQICLFDDVLDFLRYVVQVDGADRLFSKHFYDIEWNMFLEADFEKSEMKIYRDHFVHQIRNAYLGYHLMWEIGLYKNIRKAIDKYESTGFAQFINICKSKESSLVDDERFYNQLIMKTWFLAALFHDIGYPIAYHQRNSSKMDKYMPYLRVLDNRRPMDFVELSALLADTYLFKMVDYEELKDKYEKFDHGMLSAICLLLNYYHTGAIHRISNIDRCSIELSAYAIFAHTRKYAIQQEKDNRTSKLIRPVFVEDPISYILRICDDLQEWSRVYFIIGENTNTLICRRCKKTVKREENNIYKCECGQEFSKITSINYRKINLVEVCKSLDITDDEKSINFTLEYDLIKLLEVLNIDKQYAKYRQKELENLRKLLTDQALLPHMEIKFFLSNNDIEIKAEIFKRYIGKYLDSGIMKLERLTYEVMLYRKDEVEKSIIAALELENDEDFLESLRKELIYIEEYLKDNKDRKLITKKNNNRNYMDNIYLYSLINDLINR